MLVDIDMDLNGALSIPSPRPYLAIGDWINWPHRIDRATLLWCFHLRKLCYQGLHNIVCLLLELDL